MPNGRLKICLQRSEDRLRLIYYNSVTAIEYDLMIHNIGNEEGRDMEVSVMNSGYKKRNGHMLLFPYPQGQ